jgi:hypothetical protein
MEESGMMKKLLTAVPLALFAASPAHATGGMSCTTPGANPVEVNITFGHGVGAPLVGVQLIDGAAEVAVEMAQWWLDRSELRLLLLDPNVEREEVEIRARARGDRYVGTLQRGKRRLRVRCEESG